ncbi:alpha/beta hydrolase family protein [Microbacterium pumilum]|uniref:Alpha/beta fold hydrolase n=1 Tax=Microbacterium pumilum TaxID=344165 RepID=A0ABN2T235_9MICO
MIPAVGIVAIVVVIAPIAWLIRKLAFRVVGVAPRRKAIVARRVGDSVELPRSVLTSAPGRYGLWFGEEFQQHILIGPVHRVDERYVLRSVLSSTSTIPSDPFEAQLTGHVMNSPSEVDPKWEDIAIPLSDGEVAPAWLFPGRDDAPWVIHVEGIRTSRLVTLRSVEAAERAGLTSLVITYRGAGDGPAARVSYLGQREWLDLADAVRFARSRGASQVYVVAWSMGAGIALELLRHDPTAFERLALIAPATNWMAIVRHGIRRARLPAFLAALVTRTMASSAGSKLIGIPAPLDFHRLDWIDEFTLGIPTLVIHSDGDEEIPFELTREFAAAHGTVKLVATKTAPHGWEANVDPELFQSTLTAWLANPVPTT